MQAIKLVTPIFAGHLAGDVPTAYLAPFGGGVAADALK
jgi:hypothetical protein